MKCIKHLFNLVFITLLIINFSCSSDDNSGAEITPLPDGVIIEITDKNLSEGRVSLIATQTNGSQTGTWSIMTEMKLLVNLKQLLIRLLDLLVVY